MGATSGILSAKRWLGAAALAAWLCAALPAHADPLPTVWLCWLHEAQNLACIATPTGPRTAQQSARASAKLPGKGRREIFYIPLHNVPFDDSLVAELAQSVLCGKQSSCKTSYRSDLSQLVALAPTDFVDADDPVLADAGN